MHSSNMRTSLICIAVAFACLAHIRAEESSAAVETVVPVAVVADGADTAALEAAVSSDVPLVRSKRGLLLLKKLKLAKLGLVGLGLGAAKVAVVGSVLGGLKGGLGGGHGGQQQQQVYTQQPQQQQSWGQGGQLSKRTEYVIAYTPNQVGGQQQQHQQW